MIGFRVFRFMTGVVTLAGNAPKEHMREWKRVFGNRLTVKESELWKLGQAGHTVQIY